MIANCVEKLRKEKGASLEQVARAVGANKSHISKIESGKRFPGIELLFKLSRYFGCKIDEMFFEKDN